MIRQKESFEKFIKRKDLEFKHEVEIKMKDIGRKGKKVFVREAWTFLPQHNNKDKVFLFERLRKLRYSGQLSYQKNWKRGDIEYRVGYFIVGKIGRAKDRWVWGQFCPMIPESDLDKLFKKAKKDKVIL